MTPPSLCGPSPRSSVRRGSSVCLSANCRPVGDPTRRSLNPGPALTKLFVLGRLRTSSPYTTLPHPRDAPTPPHDEVVRGRAPSPLVTTNLDRHHEGETILYVSRLEINRYLVTRLYFSHGLCSHVTTEEATGVPCSGTIRLVRRLPLRDIGVVASVCGSNSTKKGNSVALPL